MRILRVDPAEHAKFRQHRLTSSRAADLMTGNYKTWNRLAWDMRGDQPIYGQTSGVPALDWGVKNEPRVRAWVWERHADWDIRPGGVIPYWDAGHPLFAEHCACSPDGVIVPNRWGLEVKAPFNVDIHLGYVRRGVLPEEYVPQVQWSLWCSGLDRWVFASGDPRVCDDEQYFDTPVQPDLEYHARITELAQRFLEGYTAGEEFKPIRATAAKFNEMFPRRGS